MKIKFLILLLLICHVSFSQNEPSFLIGGGIGYRYTDDNSNLQTPNFIQNQENLLQLNPFVGYYLTKYIAAGVSFEYLYDKTDYANYIYYSAVDKGFSFGPFIRLYAPFGLFLHSEFIYGKSRMSFIGKSIPGTTGFINYSGDYYYRSITGYSAGLGYTIEVNDFLGIEPSIRYMNGKFDGKDSKNDFTRRGLIMNIGIIGFIK